MVDFAEYLRDNKLDKIPKSLQKHVEKYTKLKQIEILQKTLNQYKSELSCIRFTKQINKIKTDIRRNR